MPVALVVVRLQRLAEGQVRRDRIQVGGELVAILQPATGERYGEFLFAQTLQLPQRGVVVDGRVDGTALEDGLCQVHGSGKLLMIRDTVAALHHFDHGRFVQIETETLRPGSDHQADAKLGDQEREDDEEVLEWCKSSEVKENFIELTDLTMVSTQYVFIQDAQHPSRAAVMATRPAMVRPRAT